MELALLFIAIIVVVLFWRPMKKASQAVDIRSDNLVDSALADRRDAIINLVNNKTELTQDHLDKYKTLRSLI